MELAFLFAVLGTGIAGIIVSLCVRHAFGQRAERDLHTRDSQ